MLAADLPEDLNVGEDNRKLCQARLQNREPKSLLGAGEEQNVRDCVELGHRVQIECVAQVVGQKDDFLLHVETRSQRLELIEVGDGSTGMVWRLRPGDDKAHIEAAVLEAAHGANRQLD